MMGRGRATPVANTTATMAGSNVIVPPGATPATGAVLAVSATVAPIAAPAIPVTGGVVSCLDCQTVRILRGCRPERALKRGRVDTSESVAKSVHGNRKGTIVLTIQSAVWPGGPIAGAPAAVVGRLTLRPQPLPPDPLQRVSSGAPLCSAQLQSINAPSLETTYPRGRFWRVSAGHICGAGPSRAGGTPATSAGRAPRRFMASAATAAECHPTVRVALFEPKRSW